MTCTRARSVALVDRQIYFRFIQMIRCQNSIYLAMVSLACSLEELNTDTTMVCKWDRRYIILLEKFCYAACASNQASYLLWAHLFVNALEPACFITKKIRVWSLFKARCCVSATTGRTICILLSWETHVTLFFWRFSRTSWTVRRSSSWSGSWWPDPLCD